MPKASSACCSNCSRLQSTFALCRSPIGSQMKHVCTGLEQGSCRAKQNIRVVLNGAHCQQCCIQMAWKAGSWQETQHYCLIGYLPLVGRMSSSCTDTSVTLLRMVLKRLTQLSVQAHQAVHEHAKPGGRTESGYRIATGSNSVFRQHLQDASRAVHCYCSSCDKMHTGERQ